MSYDRLFGYDPELEELREGYATTNGTVPDPERRGKLAAFYQRTPGAPSPDGRARTAPANKPDTLLGR